MDEKDQAGGASIDDGAPEANETSDGDSCADKAAQRAHVTRKFRLAPRKPSGAAARGFAKLWDPKW